MIEEELAGCFMTLLGSSTDGGRSDKGKGGSEKMFTTEVIGL